jgi:hypothetical protein
MTAFTEDEQLDSDLDWYAVDEQGNVGEFLTGGARLLPPSFSSNREISEKLSEYFRNLPFQEGDFTFCPDLEKNMRELKSGEINERFMPSSQKMASRGLFSYDSDNYTYKDRPYFRVAIPKKALKLAELPPEIRSILETLSIKGINFDENSLIPENITNTL